MNQVTDLEVLTFETLLNIAEKIMAAFDKSLSPSMKVTLGAMWEQKKYQDYIDENRLKVKCSTLKTQANLIHRYFGEYLHIGNLRKSNFKSSIQSLYLSGKLEEFSEVIEVPRSLTINPKQTESKLIGRTKELSSLISSLKVFRCVNIWGESGVGKSHLVREFEERHQATNGRIVWAPSPLRFKDWVSDTSTVMKLKRTENIRESLFEELFKNRWILILDDIDNLDQIFLEFIKPLCTANCQSRFIFISRARQLEIEADDQGCCLQISGLVEYDTLFESLGLSGKKRWHHLAHKYNFNPGELINIGSIIKSYLDGDVDAYLEHCSTVFSKYSIEAAAELEFSTTELRILTLINEKRTIGPNDIFMALQPDASSSDIFDSMATLQHRAVIEKTDNGFTVSPVVRKRLITEGAIG